MNNKIVINDKYPGWKEWCPSTPELEEFYQTNEAPFEMKENQFLLIRNQEGEIIDKKCFQKG